MTIQHDNTNEQQENQAKNTPSYIIKRRRNYAAYKKWVSENPEAVAAIRARYKERFKTKAWRIKGE